MHLLKELTYKILKLNQHNFDYLITNSVQIQKFLFLEDFWEQCFF